MIGAASLELKTVRSGPAFPKMPHFTGKILAIAGVKVAYAAVSDSVRFTYCSAKNDGKGDF